MSNRELRALAWARYRGRWNTLVAANGIFLFVLLLLTWVNVWFLADRLAPVVGVLGNFMSFGLAGMALAQLRGQPQRLSDLFFWARKDRLMQYLILAALLWALMMGSGWVVGKVAELGQGMRDAAFGDTLIQAGSSYSYYPMEDPELYRLGTALLLAGSLLKWAVTLVLHVVLLPMTFLPALLPESGLGQLVKLGFSVGWRQFGRIFGYLVVLYLPLFGAVVPGMLLFTLSQVLGVLGIIAMIGFFIWYVVYVTLAETAMIGELVSRENGGGKSLQNRKEVT